MAAVQNSTCFRCPPVSSSTHVRVISMSLYGSERRYTMGAVRNAQLAPVIYPGWTLRFYCESPTARSRLFAAVPPRLLWPPCAIGQAIIFFVLWFLLPIFYLPVCLFLAYSQPSEVDWMLGLGLGLGLALGLGLGLALVFGPSATLGCRSKIYADIYAGNIECKNDAKIAICTSSHDFVGLYLRN